MMPDVVQVAAITVFGSPQECPSAGMNVLLIVSLHLEQCWDCLPDLTQVAGRSTVYSWLKSCPSGSIDSVSVESQFSLVQRWNRAPFTVQVASLDTMPSSQACPNAGTTVVSIAPQP